MGEVGHVEHNAFGTRDDRDDLAVKAVADQPGDKLANATRRNVLDNVAKLKAAAPILSAAVTDGKIKIVGGIYRLKTGKVELVA